MAESLDASRDIDRIRKELEAVNKKLDAVGKRVEGVDGKVDRSNANQLGALAGALAADNVDIKREALFYAAGMSIPDIAKALGKSENAVRVSLSRAGLTKRKPKRKRGSGG